VRKNNRLALAVTTVLSTCAAAAGAAESTSGIEEIIVTAQRRTESIQSVPITIQAITGDQLGQLSVATFDDVIKLLPNVTFGANGPGQGNIFMRGLSAGFAGNQSSASVAPMPNVATYLDDQDMSFPARNADVYMVDMQRIEVLEGPQGTLFGGGAEAGVIRYITNKPKLNKTEGAADFSYGTTAHGDPNTAITGVINLPVIQDKLAFRLAAYNDRRGGYIDNLPTTFTRYSSDPGPAAWGSAYPAAALVGPSGNNYQIAQRAQNPVSYTGMRASLLYQINDDWDVLLQQSYQNLDAEGIFAQYPYGSEGASQPLGQWQETSFSPTYDVDKYSATAWTVNGKVGALRAIYTGSYLHRHIEQNMDYTNYARTAYGFYYTCAGGPAGGSNIGAGTPGICYSPITSWHDTVYNSRVSHEFRLSTPDDWRLRGLVGAFWERNDIKDDQNFMYKTIPSCIPAYFDATGKHLPTAPVCLANVIPYPGTAAIDPSQRNDNVAYGQDLDRNFTQTAFFGSVDFDLIPKVLTLTGGTRYFRYAESMYGSRYLTSTPNTNVPNGSVLPALVDHRADYSGFRSRGNLTWHVTPDTMVYYTFSQGYRPGSFNRVQSTKTRVYVDANNVPLPNYLPITDPSVVGPVTKPKQFRVPAGYPPDSLTNNEIGFKTEFLDRRLQVNGSLYKMNWKDVQTLIYNPLVFGNGTFGIKGPEYEIKGLELQLAARVTDALTLQGSFSHNSSSQTNAPCVASSLVSSTNPTPLGTCITQVIGTDAAGRKVNVPVINPLGAPGSTPAFSPKNQYSLRARYDWTVGDYKAFAMVGGTHTDEMENEPSSFTAGATGYGVPTTTWLRYKQPAYSLYDVAAGVAKDNWSVEAYGTNVTNVNASLFTSSAQWIKAEVPTRPRVLGLKIGLKF
jgi:iron complex outermembrane recepter protein